MTDAEVQANLSFADVKRGQRLQVDIHDPRVAGLIDAGYLKIIWKEPDGTTAVDDSAGTGGVSAAGVDSGVSQSKKPKASRKVTSGADSGEPPAEDRDGASAGGAADPADE